MKANIITKDMSLLLGFRLGGIDGCLIDKNDQILKNFNQYSRNKETALIIFSKDCYELIKDEVESFRQIKDKPLIVVLD
ncbi:V-type ATP synthase subunit F [Anaerococcus sp. AGMB00486]|uniref:V-type ATP synthase subunit F n=2 Tax=Anaerococcus TaxID=165779 RepID=A0ABX2N758_9FIRM|nr:MULTISPECIES: V-type ATP synthase subunit F [Anaerococcus]MDY3007171.1 V-type ATP synthase subunit F [Anaerococcus porci]MSS76992.1 hypothetical protein [Anaerococcus porci]NVF10519.1 V-type ATP synthase subunit F [Anaerococcus faecalis]